MSPIAPQPDTHFRMVCHNCQRIILARQSWVGRDVACPHCQGAMHVPPPTDDSRPPIATAPSITANRYFNFACGRCDALLESHSGMSGRRGDCPTCGAAFRVPFLNPRTQSPGPTDMLEPDDQLPTPMHAYATSGQLAPEIIRNDGGEALIICPRCGDANEIDADHCAGCGAPFTLDGAATGRGSRARRFAIAALVVGILALPMFFLVAPALAAIVLGFLGLRRGYSGGPPITAIVGLLLGVVSLTGAVLLYMLT